MINEKILSNFLEGAFGTIFKKGYMENLEEFRILHGAKGTTIDIPFHPDDHTDFEGSTIVVKVFVGTLAGLKEMSLGKTRVLSLEKGSDKLTGYDTPESRKVMEKMEVQE